MSIQKYHEGEKIQARWNGQWYDAIVLEFDPDAIHPCHVFIKGVGTMCVLLEDVRPRPWFRVRDKADGLWAAGDVCPCGDRFNQSRDVYVDGWSGNVDDAYEFPPNWRAVFEGNPDYEMRPIEGEAASEVKGDA